jgi:hypothetical protein
MADVTRVGEADRLTATSLDSRCANTASLRGGSSWRWDSAAAQSMAESPLEGCTPSSSVSTRLVTLA